MLLRHHSEHEERREYAFLAEEVEQEPGAAVHAVFEAAPVLGWDLEALIPVLEVDREGVHAAPSHGSGTMGNAQAGVTGISHEHLLCDDTVHACITPSSFSTAAPVAARTCVSFRPAGRMMLPNW